MQIHTTPALRFERKSEIISKLGISKSTFHSRINEGEYPPLILIGERVVAYLSHETDAVISAIAAGKNKDELKQLAIEIVEHRNKLKTGALTTSHVNQGDEQ